MAINSREVARHLYQLAELYRAEASRLSAMGRFSEAVADLGRDIEREAEEVQDLANYLHELKENIGS